MKIVALKIVVIVRDAMPCSQLKEDVGRYRITGTSQADTAVLSLSLSLSLARSSATVDRILTDLFHLCTGMYMFCFVLRYFLIIYPSIVWIALIWRDLNE